MPPQRAPNSISQFVEKWLTYGERVFKTDLRFLIKGGFWSTVGQFASSGSALILSLAVSRWVPKEAYGEYKYVLAFVAVLGSVCLNGIGTSVFISTARGFGRALPDGFIASLKWSTLVFLGALGIGAYYLYLGNYTLGVGILVGGCLAPFLTSANLYNAYLAGKKDFRRQSLYGVVGTVLPALLILLTVFFHPTALALVLAYFIGNTLVTIGLYYYTLRLYRAHVEEKDPELVPYAWHQSAMGILTTITGNVDQLFLFHFVGAVEVAIYNFATGVLDQSKGPIKSLDAMVQTRFANQKTQSIRDGMNNKMLWLFVVSAVVVIAYIIVAPYLYLLLFPTYIASVKYSQVYAISLLGTYVGPANSYLSAKKKVRAQYISTIINSVLQIVAILVGIIFFGLWGLIWARVVIRLGGAFAVHILYHQEIIAES
jgi:O-antigen/teichoic acid export membrane protein